MIGHLRGRILEKHPNQVILEVNGVGYDVNIPVSTFYQLPDPPGEAQLHIHTHVREEALALYGFLTTGEKRVFEKLLGVSGIGPRLAITILSGLEVAELVPAIRNNDLVKLTHIPGVGRKTAERIVLELRDKLAEVEGLRAAAAPAGFSIVQEDALSALLNLGYQRSAAERAVGRAAEQERGGSFDALLRRALQLLVKT
ncbi:MAG: Holliday junction branch migration protein RuvA [Acidobacteria bacterium]|jgi:Holliday junction DNA helicase RuvA|nr:Holliday junction branch migration protein RuvA [Acidobacteriota bacterium]